MGGGETSLSPVLAGAAEATRDAAGTDRPALGRRLTTASSCDGERDLGRALSPTGGDSERRLPLPRPRLLRLPLICK